MKKLIFILGLALTACSVQPPLSERIVRSEMARSFALKWTYTTGLELKAMLDAAPELSFDYVEAWYDAIIDTLGVIYSYRPESYSSDDVCPARTLFTLYDQTGKEKYRLAMDRIYDQITRMPRTPEGGFFHKGMYPQQMWLDGLYMVEPFYTEYTLRYVTDSTARQANLEDIVRQFSLIYSHTLDPGTGLLRHAWDASGEMFWCDPQSGQSAHSWGRAMGWYLMALVDVIEIYPDGVEKDVLIGQFQQLMEAVARYADAQTGMWYQVLDSPYREGNYLEASCSAMFTYAGLKGARLALLPDRDRYLQRYQNLIQTFVTEEDGLVTLHSCCKVAGLGGPAHRQGDFDYYISEPVCDNDPKGIGPLIWAALEHETE